MLQHNLHTARIWIWETANVDDLACVSCESGIAGSIRPKLHSKGNTDFQLTRGLLGISM